MPALPPALALALALLLPSGCGGEAGERGGAEAAGEPERQVAPAPAGIPVSEPTGEIDEALAERGEETFKARGCVACHTVGKGRLVGPDLQGVTDRREFPWFYHMVMNPDSMLRNDSTARALLGEYMVPMLYQDVQPEEVPAIWEYLREEGGETEEGGEEGDG